MDGALMPEVKYEDLQVGAPLPKSVGLCADLYHDVRELRLAMQKHVEAVQARENEIREHIINNLSKSDDTGAAGKRYRAQIVVKAKPSLKDWDAFTQYVVKSGRFDLLHKRVADKPIKELWEDGVAVPGVEQFKAVEVSITKI
jgi:hypothetical protein